MNGQLSEQPPAELIREISEKSLGGRLRLEQKRVKVVAYFDSGNFLYAASNVRTLRLREYLRKDKLVSEQDLARFGERLPDIDLLKLLRAQNLLSPADARQLQTRQMGDVLRLALLWTEGVWEFESRSRLNEALDLKIDVGPLLLEASRRMPAKFATSRFGDPAELIIPVPEAFAQQNLVPEEVFLLSRLDKPTALQDLLAISGMNESETLGIVYSLALAGLVKRQNWKNVLGEQQPSAPVATEETPQAAVEREQTRQTEDDASELENFLERVKNAQTFYDVLGVDFDVPQENLKTVYYQLARRYHPDRFRKAEPELITRIGSVFARITQAYETLRDEGLRANYNAKLAARKKVEQLSDSAPKATPSQSQPKQTAAPVSDAVISEAERAETQFKEGFAALELGQRKVAMGLFASAVSAVPNEARYRAFYGHALAGEESTRRKAETELLAAIKLDSGNSEYRVMLAELYRDLGLKLRARGEAERAVAADPNNRKARELLRALK